MQVYIPFYYTSEKKAKYELLLDFESQTDIEILYKCSAYIKKILIVENSV